MKNKAKAWIILSVYLIATCSLLLWGYRVQQPAIPKQEFPFTVTYTYEGSTETISGIYIAEYVRDAKYIGDDPLKWDGHIKDRDILEADYYTILKQNDKILSIKLNLDPGYLMGDPKYANVEAAPSGVYHLYDGTNETEITDPTELASFGFFIESWEFPEPIANSFSFAGVSLSSEATIYTAIIAVVALLASMIFIRKEKELCYGISDKISIITNLLISVVAFPFILITSCLVEIVADTSFLYQILYLSPAITALGIAASVTARRMGYKWFSFLIQFAGPAIVVIIYLLEKF